MTVSMAELAAEGVLSFSDGYRTKRSEHGQPGFRILRVADVADGRIVADGDDYVARDYKSQVGAKLSEAGDVLLTTKGTVGRVAVIPAHADQVVYSPQLCYFRVRDEARLDRTWLSYWFKSADFLRQAAHRANNTDMAAYINLADIGSLKLPETPISRQRAIAEVLGALDDKIAANSRLVELADRLRLLTIEHLSRDGVSVPLSSLAAFVNGRAFTKGASGTGRVVIRIAELNSGLGNSTVYSDVEVAEQHVAQAGDLLFAWSGSLTVHRWYRAEGIVNQHIFKVIPAEGRPLWLVDAAMRRKLADFRGIAADKATTMGHIQRQHLDEPVGVPTGPAIRQADRAMGALWDRALAAEQESLMLTETRDTLLPLLMSGTVKVKDAEAIIEGVV